MECPDMPELTTVAGHCTIDNKFCIQVQSRLKGEKWRITYCTFLIGLTNKSNFSAWT